MNTSIKIDRPGYKIKLLQPEDAPVLQTLYEQCIDFLLLTNGHPPQSTAALEEFDDLPEGNTADDKYIFGLFDPQNNLIGMIESIRHYPDGETWWLGLMMITPQQRGKSLGSDFYWAFERWVWAQGIRQISLLVIEANAVGFQFWQSLGFKMVRRVEAKQFGNKTHGVYILRRA